MIIYSFKVLYLGGHPLLSPNRAIRQADLSNGGNSGLAVIHGNLRAEPITLSGSPLHTTQTDHFKGIIQDVQVLYFNIQFH